MKLIIKALATLVLLLTTILNSKGNVGIHSGPYMGVSIGLSNLGGKQDFKAIDTFEPPFDLFSQSLGSSLFGGYGLRLNNFWIAAEISYLFDQLDSETKFRLNPRFREKILRTQSDGAYEGSLKFGYIFCENLAVYAIGGAEFRQFQMSFKDNDITARLNEKYRSIAFVPGLGFHLNFTKNVGMRVEYKCAFYPSKTVSLSAPSGILKQSPRIHALKTGLIYIF